MAKIWRKATFPSIEDLAKEVAIKKRLTSELKHSIRALQQENVGKKEFIYEGDKVNNVCCSLEAIFIHGLKYKLTTKVSAVFGSNADKMPEPDFWPVIMVYSHKDVLLQIRRLNQITTDVGRCRAWLRLALNDSSIGSYIETMLADKSTLHSYYNSYAYLRDVEAPDIMRLLLDGLGVFTFQLAFNSVELNVWNSAPLVLAGIWSPPVTLHPVMPAVDVIEFFTEQDMKSQAKDKKGSQHSSKDTSSDKIANEEGESVTVDGHQITKESTTIVNNVDNSKEESSAFIKLKSELGDSSDTSAPSSIPDFGPEFLNEISNLPDNAGSNRLHTESGWSSAFLFEEDTPSVKESDAEPEDQSFDSLLQSYNKNLDKTLVGTPEISDMMTSAVISTESHEDIPEDSSGKFSGLDYEVISRTYAYTSEAVDEETRQLLSLIGKICPEQGLDVQNYQCHSCGCQVGMIYGKPRLCYYDGFSYCSECHKNDEHLIPARIIYNWDFKKYPVSKHAKSFLTGVEEEPLINLKVMNPLIYTVIEEMQQLQELRTQLTFLRSYIFTCKESIAEELRRKLWPREYLYEHIHLYSVNDLLQTASGILQQTLQKTVHFARKHVLSCQLCNLKGFICEICKSPKIIYPFDIETTYHCEHCLAVYHSACMDVKKFCPKCERRRKREENQDSSWHVE